MTTFAKTDIPTRFVVDVFRATLKDAVAVEDVEDEAVEAIVMIVTVGPVRRTYSQIQTCTPFADQST